MSEPEIRVVRMPWIFGIAFEIAPLVRRGIITDSEGRELVARSYRRRLLAVAPESGLGEEAGGE